ncbi:hypothetical protein [Herpetosiphon gulosus]|uniref:Zinc ribbon domain-containing protein n=1 Tax=Herpetosiphon gulosus TaxID=1973496 RepID=A0ABP9X1G8_9CHLR
MQCPHCAMTMPMVSDNCPYCGKSLRLRQAQNSISLQAFGSSMFLDAILMLAALGLGIAQRASDSQSFRMLTSISQPSIEWPVLWASLSYGYGIVALLALLGSISCMITKNRRWAMGTLLCGMAGVAILATFGAGILFNDSGYSPGFGLWIGLFGSFTLTTSSLMFQFLTRK